MVRPTAQPQRSGGLAVGKGDGDRTTATELTDLDSALVCSSACRPALHCTALHHLDDCHSRRLADLCCSLCRWGLILGCRCHRPLLPLGGVFCCILHLRVPRR